MHKPNNELLLPLAISQNAKFQVSTTKGFKIIEFAVIHKNKSVVALFTSFFDSISDLVTKMSIQSKFQVCTTSGSR